MKKEKSNILKFEASYEEMKGFYKITIDRGEVRYSQSGVEERRASGILFIPKVHGIIPEKITINIKGKEMN